jgi:hypothetical protein
MKYPGKIADKQLEDWFTNAASKAGYVPIIVGKGKINPCLKLHGPGPADKRCKDCALFIRREMSKTYFKCELRGITRGPATDHRANWPTCGKFQTLEAK